MPVRARRGRRPLGSPDARRAVLDAARELFAELGFERTTMRAVAARAGVDPALIYHYFADKDGLLFAALTIVVKQDSIGTNFLVAILALVGGMYFPVTLLPHWLQVAGQLQPFTPATRITKGLASPMTSGFATGASTFST